MPIIGYCSGQPKKCDNETTQTESLHTCVNIDFTWNPSWMHARKIPDWSPPLEWYVSSFWNDATGVNSGI